MELPQVATEKNAPGPFVVLEAQCIACEAPLAEAPSLMAWDDENVTCYFRRQPETPAELKEAIDAVNVSCCGALKYLGNDPAIQRKIETRVPVQSQSINEAGSRSPSAMQILVVAIYFILVLWFWIKFG